MSDKFDIYRQLLSEGATSDIKLFCNNPNDDLIIIGGTRQQTLNLSFSLNIVDDLSLLYVQNDIVVVRKSLSDLTVSEFDKTLVYFTLSEYETLLFDEGDVSVQVKARLLDGSVIVSDLLKLKAIHALDNQLTTGEQLIALRISVKDRDVNVVNYSDIVAEISSDKFNYSYKCKFVFDRSWDNFSKTVLFKDESNHFIQTDIENDECYIPSLVLQNPGNIYIGVSGVMKDIEHKSINKATTWSNSIKVISSPQYDIASKYFSGDSDIIKIYKDDGLMSIDVAVTQDVPEIVIGFEGVE